jgi:hypothetical protein
LSHKNEKLRDKMKRAVKNWTNKGFSPKEEQQLL